MNGYELSLIDLMIRASINAHLGLFTSPMGDLISEISPGKMDTLGMDWTAETRIRNTIKEFDPRIILVTEEDEPERKEWPRFTNLASREILMISDPIDRSSQMNSFLTKMSAGCGEKSIMDRIGEIDIVDIWVNQIAEKPAVITGGTTAITCLIGGKVLATVIVNHIYRNIIIAVEAGLYMHTLDVPEKELKNIDMTKIIKKGKGIFFQGTEKTCSSVSERKRFTAFAGKKGYPENLQQSNIFIEDCMANIHHTAPGGPTRVFYLSSLQKEHGPIGFILYNGEKITEWIHALPVVKYAKDVKGNPVLRIYEVSIDKPNVKEGILMSCHPTYSIFTQREGEAFIDVAFLRRFPASSHYRSMLVIVPSDNSTVIDAMNKHGFPELSDCL